MLEKSWRSTHESTSREVMSDVVELMFGIKKSRTTPNHPEGNAQCERFNHSMHDLLRTLASEKKKKWTEHLPELLYAYNATPHSSTGHTPYYLLFGREPKLPVDILLGEQQPSEDPPNTVHEWLATHQSLLRDAFQKAGSVSSRQPKTEKPCMTRN